MSGVSIMINNNSTLDDIARLAQEKEPSKYVCIVSSSSHKEYIQIYDKLAISQMLQELKVTGSDDIYNDKRGNHYKFFRPLYKLKEDSDISSSVCGEDRRNNIRLYIPFTKPLQAKTFSLLLK